MKPHPIEDIYSAHRRILAFIHETPILTSSSINRELDRSLFFKCENFQKTGAFKFRGAMSAITALTEDQARRSVITHSSGNHAAALALAAKLNHIDCHVVIPEDAPEFKKKAAHRYGAHVNYCPPGMLSRQALAEDLVRSHGYTLIPPYDDHNIICGQGTATLELLRQVGSLDALILPIGGGGLIAGASIVLNEIAPATDLIGVEPELADEAKRSLDCGRILPATERTTIADGLQAGVGVLNFQLIKKHVRQIYTATEDQIRTAMHMIWQRMKIIIEPSAAVALAALLFSDIDRKYQRIGTIFTGGNIDLSSIMTEYCEDDNQGAIAAL